MAASPRAQAAAALAVGTYKGCPGAIRPLTTRRWPLPSQGRRASKVSQGAAADMVANMIAPSLYRGNPLHAASTASSAASQAALSTPADNGRSTTPSTPLLSLSEVSARLASKVHSQARDTFLAMYSSWVGGITIDPAAMVIPLDDHMVHRGHGVFDTALLIDGYLYELDDHLDRFLRSAAKARITPPFDRGTIRDILLETTAASNCRDGVLRYWLSAGPGNFHLSTSACVGSTLYAVVVYEIDKQVDQVKVITTSVPIKPPQFATVKSVNYLPNALSLMEAEDQGTAAGIWLDEQGFIAEGPNMNVAFVDSSGVLLVPTFDKILAGCTVKRMLALASEHLLNQEETHQLGSDGVGPLKGIRMGDITVEEARACPEMMLVGSGVIVMPVTEWDGRQVGDGSPGEVTKFLLRIVREDMLHGSAPQRIPIPFKS